MSNDNRQGRRWIIEQGMGGFPNMEESTRCGVYILHDFQKGHK